MRENKQKISKKNGNCNSLCRDIVFFVSRHNFKQAKITMSQPAPICSNKIQNKLRHKLNLCSDKEFYVVTLVKKNEKKRVATVLNFSTTMIKAERKGAVSR